MIIPASNEFIIKTLNQVSLLKVQNVTSREVYDYSRYSMLEFLSFDNKDKKYVLKTVRSPLKHEIAIHRFINEFPINGANFIVGFTSDFLNLHFILMEYIENLTPVYSFDDQDLIEDYAQLASNLAYFHVNATKYIKNAKKLQVIDYNYDYYLKLLDKFCEKIPVLSKEIAHDLYLTPDIVERYLNNTEKIKHQLFRIKPLKRTLVHGDFDIGNIFFKVTGDHRQIMAIDWGLSHIDHPIVDMANLLHSLEALSFDSRDYILDSYLHVAGKKFPRNYEMNDFQSLGMILHRLFFIGYQLDTLETSSTSMEEYYEEMHNALDSLCQIIEKLD